MIKTVEDGIRIYKEKLAVYYKIKFKVNLKFAHDVEENVYNESADHLYVKIIGMQMALGLTREEREKYKQEVKKLLDIK